jgi:hypothetical protein
LGLVDFVVVVGADDVDGRVEVGRFVAGGTVDVVKFGELDDNGGRVATAAMTK